jgi:hypothetical protein
VYGLIPTAYGYDAFGEYGASEKKCAKLLKRMDKLRGRRSRKAEKFETRGRRFLGIRVGSGKKKLSKLDRRISKMKSRYLKKGCADIVENGYGPLYPKAAAKAAQDVAAERIAQAEAETEVIRAEQAAAQMTAAAPAQAGMQQTWLIGGAAVAALLTFVFIATKK